MMQALSALELSANLATFVSAWASVCQDGRALLYYILHTGSAIAPNMTQDNSAL